MKHGIHSAWRNLNGKLSTRWTVDVGFGSRGVPYSVPVSVLVSLRIPEHGIRHEWESITGPYSVPYWYDTEVGKGYVH